MDDLNKQMKEWIEKTYPFSFPEWNKLPDIELYMDQVMWVFKKQFSYIDPQEIDKLMSPSMINNYVKANVVTRPNNKKYSKEQISQLYQIAFLKSILPIDSIKLLQNVTSPVTESQELYNAFIKRVNEMFQKELLETDKAISEDSSLTRLAFQLALEAGIKKIIADQIIALIRLDQKEKQAKKEKLPKTTK